MLPSTNPHASVQVPSEQCTRPHQMLPTGDQETSAFVPHPEPLVFQAHTFASAQ